MRDPLLNEALKRLAAESATRFATLVAGGDQIPFDVAESAGPDDGLFHSYVPLTGRYVREREAELRSLAAFEPARDAVELAEVAAPYLERRGESVAAESGARAARMLTVFIADLWEGCTEFALDRERLESALAVLDAEAGDGERAELLLVPVAGLKMSVPRLRLPHEVEIVRADAIEAPVDAMRSEGMGRAAWEPQFLALAELGEGIESAGAALEQLQDLISVMRLFKRGGVGLGPYAFAPTGEGRWRRIATGAPAPRAGGYRLDAEETEGLIALAETLGARPDPAGSLAWAVRRFELGCERPDAPEGLSDHLLALRAVLDGQGPVGASLPMRAAALISDDSTDRLGARERIETAMQLERAQMAGARTPGAGELAGWVEDCVRRILRQAALGELGTDLNASADETLIATGLDSGDAAIAVAPEEPVSASEIDPTPVWSMSDTSEKVPTSEEEIDEMDQETRILEPVPAEDEIRITATNWLEEVEEDDRVEVAESTLDFPAVSDDLERRERIDTPRVRHLFPVPEDADWEVGELHYDHYERRGTA